MRHVPFAAMALACAALLIAPRGSAAGEKVRATLRYDRLDAAAAACPGDATMRQLVAAELGYDPFVEEADLAIAIELRPKGSELVGRIELTSKSVGKRGERTLRSPGGDCSELASSVALAVALAIDPDAVRARPAPPLPAPAPPPLAAPPPPPPAPIRPAPIPPREPAVRASRGVELGARVDAGVVVGGGIVPGVAFGPRLGAALAGKLWSIAVEGTAILPGSQHTPFGDVSALVVYGSIVPCLGLPLEYTGPRSRPVEDRARVDLCVTASVGAMFAEAHSVTHSFPTTDVYASTGPRASFTFMPWRSVGFRASADLGIALSRVHLTIDDVGVQREAWVSDELSFLGGVAGVVRFR